MSRHILKIDEPSGITTDGAHLFIVSDRNGKVFKTNFIGAVLETFDSGKKDLEGIAFNRSSYQFALVSEEKRKMYLYDTEGIEISEFKIKGKQERKNSGLEGIAFNTRNQSYYLVNEKKPRQLLKLNADFEIAEKFKLDFLYDISGLCYDEDLDVFWAVSDESRSIYKITTKGKLIQAYPFNLKQMEGIACLGSKLFVVSDAVEVLVVFEKPH